MSKIQVLIADDHAILRAGLRMLINHQRDMVVVGEAEDWESARRELSRHKPDVMTVDLTMPGGDAFALLRQLRKESVSTKLLVLTMHEDVAYFRAAIAAGADGYVLKKAADEELMTAIRCVMTGRVYATIELNDAKTIETPTENDTAAGTPALAALSAREREVLQCAAQGLTNREIAERLFLSVKTIESYRARLMAKLGLKSRAEMVQYAVRHGMLAAET
jgi:two-component system response regulator NreC